MNVPHKPIPASDTTDYVLAIFDASGHKVFVRSERGKLSLPQITIPKFTRTLEIVTSYVQQQLKLSASLLRWEESPSPHSSLPYFILEARRMLSPGSGYFWHDVRDAYALETSQEFVKSCHEHIHRATGNEGSPFVHRGWIDELIAWVERTLGQDKGTVHEFMQLSGGGDTCLVRFDTGHQRFWYKAVGSSDAREFKNTIALCRSLPAYLPTVHAFDAERHAWLSSSGGDSTLREHRDVEAWAGVIVTLATMQLKSVCYTADFLEAGFQDLGSTALLKATEPFFSLMNTLMACQEKNPPAPMTGVELLDTASALRAAIVELHKLQLPNTVGHSDFNPGNVLLSEKRSVFIDWSAAHVGSPLLTMEYLLAHFRKHHPELRTEIERLRELYLQKWSEVVPKPRMRRAMQLSPIVAIFASAIASGSWQDQPRLERPGVAGYLRSLARMMHREAQSLEMVPAYA